jgi:CelD/BcsL family acetyltransferase involved in cellulose biosynthesis
VAGAIFFHFGKTAIFKFGASDDSFHKLRVNNLVIWQAIKWHVQQGFSMLDFGRTSLGNEGLRRFKLSWGTEERLIDYVRYNRRTDSFVRVRDRSSGWHNHVIKMLPDCSTRLIGTALYKHIA